MNFYIKKMMSIFIFMKRNEMKRKENKQILCERKEKKKTITLLFTKRKEKKKISALLFTKRKEKRKKKSKFPDS